jgi:DNA-binding transcriptional ArsR family regulator
VESGAEARPTRAWAVDLRHGRAPDVEVLVSEVYDFLISLRIVLASPEQDFSYFDVGRDWMDTARARCQATDARALDVLGHYFGDARRSSLHASIISLVWLCPEPRAVPHFLEWLLALPASEFAEVLLNQDGLGSDWAEALAAALAAPGSEKRLKAVLARFDEELRPTVEQVVTRPAEVRAEIVGALHTWNDAVFTAEIARIHSLLEREAAAMERARAKLPREQFLQEVMHGVQWQRPTGLKRMVFAPSYFSRPAVFYEFWKGTLTFIPPVDDTRLEPAAQAPAPEQPSAELLHFFEALGDPTRLRILHLLADREMYLTELADALQLTKATVKHHMVKLRAAGLATLNDREKMTYYTLRRDVSRRSRRLLDDFLNLK